MKRTFLIACATAPELRAFLSRLTPCESALEAACAAGAPLSMAALPRLDVAPDISLLPLVCGVGPVASALALGRCLGCACRSTRGGSEPLPHGLIIAGLAGTYDPVSAPVGSLVIAREECLPEYGVWPDAGEAIRNASSAPGEPQPLTLPQSLCHGAPVFNRLDMAPDKALGMMGLSCHSDSRTGSPRQGVSLTVAGVSGSPGRARRLCAMFQGLTENMEGFSLALGAMQADLPCFEIRAVSNEAGFRPPQTWNMDAAMRALGDAGHMLFAPH